MQAKVDTKVFVGKNIEYAAVFKKKDQRTIYNMIYRDGKKGTSFINVLLLLELRVIKYMI